jgi:hypothetical protein
VERITHYAVIELAVRLRANSISFMLRIFLMVSSQIFSFFLGFLFQSIQVTFGVFGFGVAAILVVRALIFRVFF